MRMATSFNDSDVDADVTIKVSALTDSEVDAALDTLKEFGPSRSSALTPQLEASLRRLTPAAAAPPEPPAWRDAPTAIPSVPQAPAAQPQGLPGNAFSPPVPEDPAASVVREPQEATAVTRVGGASDASTLRVLDAVGSVVLSAVTSLRSGLKAVRLALRRWWQLAQGAGVPTAARAATR